MKGAFIIGGLIIVLGSGLFTLILLLGISNYVDSKEKENEQLREDNNRLKEENLLLKFGSQVSSTEIPLDKRV